MSQLSSNIRDSNQMLTGFQLRAGRGVLNLFNKDLAQKIGLHYSTLVRLAENTPNLSYLKSNLSTSILLNNFFETNGVYCNIHNSLRLKTTNVCNTNNKDVITRFQLKAARIAMNLTQKELGYYINIPQSTISDLENYYNNKDILNLAQCSFEIVNNFFTRNGIAFPDLYTITLKDDPVTILGEQKKVFDTERQLS